MMMIPRKLKIVAMVVMSGVALVGAGVEGMRLSQNVDTTIDEREAFKAGAVYGQRAADMARTKGIEMVSFEDSAIDVLRVTLTAHRYQDTRLPFIDGFRQGYETRRVEK
ncbi:MAG: hypothetical protein IT581_07780 [Verrucomicrobiales bacterium]|nr:hypothetical protein [Verrucomicrobiales bacterium]